MEGWRGTVALVVVVIVLFVTLFLSIGRRASACSSACHELGARRVSDVLETCRCETEDGVEVAPEWTAP